MEFLLHKESGIIRNRRKIEAAVHNAQVARSVQKECGSLAAYIWGLVPDSRPICNWHRYDLHYLAKPSPKNMQKARIMIKDLELGIRT